MSQPSRKKIVASYDAIYAAAHILRRRGVRTTSLANDAYLRFGTRWHEVSENESEAKALARTLVTRTLIDRARRASAQKRQQPKGVGEEPRTTQNPLDLASDVREAMSPLEARDPAAARVVRSLFFDGLELEEVADRCGFSRSKVVRLRRRGLDQLQRGLDDYRRRSGRD